MASMQIPDQAFLDFGHDLILTIMPTGELRLANAPALAALGLAESDLSGRNIREWVTLDSLEEWETCLEAAEAGVSINGANITLQTGNDPKMMVEANLKPNDNQIVVYLRSLTEQQRVRQALEESETRLRTVLSSMPDLIMVFDQSGRYRQIYTSEAGVLVSTPEKMIGKTLHEVVVKEEADLGMQRLRQVIETQQPLHFEYELFIDDEKKWFSAKAVPFGTERDPCVLWVARDVTTLVGARQQKERDSQLIRDLLELEQKARDVIAYEIHDGFVQYAVGTQMWLQSGIDQLDDVDPDVRDAFENSLDSIEQAVADARAMIRDLRPTGIDGEGLEDGLRSLVEVMQARSTVPIEFVCDSKPPPLLRLLETQIFRMAQESLNNVIRHSQATRAEVKLSMTDDTVVLEIKDDGCGFDIDQVPSGHYGIEGILRRTHVFGGEGNIISKPGDGTLVSIRMPLLKPDA